MNILYKLILGAALGLFVTGCKKHLEEKSQDEVKPTTVTELQQLLMGEVYPAGSARPGFHPYLDMLTDDVSSNFNNNKGASLGYQKYTPVFTWRNDMFELMEAAQ